MLKRFSYIFALNIYEFNMTIKKNNSTIRIYINQYYISQKHLRNLIQNEELLS